MVTTFVKYCVFVMFLSQMMKSPVSQRTFLGNFVEKIMFSVERTS